VKKVNTIVVHQNPHLDEIVAVWFLRNFGEEKFPGVSEAKLTTWGRKELSRTTPEMCAMSGTLLVGLGGGMFDDHQDDGVRKDCAAGLVAKYLGLDKLGKLKKLINDTYLADAKCEGELYSKAEEVKNLNRYWVGSIDVERLYAQVEPAILAIVARQEEYLEAKKVFYKAYKQEVGPAAIVAVDKLDNRQFQCVARNMGGNVIVQRNADGLTQIFGFDDLQMDWLAARIRKHELYASQIKPRHFLSGEYLASAGTVPEVPHWHLDRNNLLNGSESFTDVPPSGIPFRELVNLVEKHAWELFQAKADGQDGEAQPKAEQAVA